MRPGRSAIVALLLAAAIAVAFGAFASRAIMLGWLTAASTLATSALSAVMLLCMLKLGGSRLLDAWQPPLLAVSSLLWFVPVVCLPLVINAASLYRWSAEAAFDLQRAYLNVPFFAGRIAVYACACVAIAMGLPLARKPVSFVVMLLLAFVVANAISIDTLMALTPMWHSSDFGLRGCVNGALTGAALAVAWHGLNHRGVDDITLRARIDGATLLFAQNIGWLYLLFVDYVTAWSGNLPDEVVWYAPRTQGTWGIAIVAVVATHATVAALLLSRLVKRSPVALIWLAAILLVAELGESLWTAIPGTGVEVEFGVGASVLSFAVVAVGASGWFSLAKCAPRRMAHG